MNMDTESTSQTDQNLWSRSSADQSRRELLIDHIQTVAKLTGATCGKMSMPGLGMLCGVFHDADKASNLWQNYLNSCREDGLIVPHAPASARFFASLLDEKQMGEKLKNIAIMTCQIGAAAIWGHHSGLSDMATPERGLYEETVWAAMSPDEIEGMRAFERACCSRKFAKALFGKAVHEVEESWKSATDWTSLLERDEHESSTCYRNRQIRGRMFLMGLFLRGVYSGLIDSDRYAAACWELGVTSEGEPDRAELWGVMAQNLVRHLDEFPQDTDVTRQRRRISDRCVEHRPKKPGVYRLDIPTGGGKTLTSVRLALELCQEQKLDRIILVAPVTTILEQTARELRSALGRPDVILEYHSNLWAERDEKQKDEKLAARDLYGERWDAPVVITSQVEFLNCLFSGRSASARRMHRLFRSVIIIDEAQTLPAHCRSLFNLSAFFLTAIAGSTIVLCTATQPPLETSDFPLILSPDADLLSSADFDMAPFNRTDVVDLTGDASFEMDDLASFIVRQLEVSPSVLAVLNTKRAVRDLFVELQKRLNGGVKLYHLSTAMCPAHRAAVLEKMRAELAVGESVVCVSTNLIEAGVDISFGCAVRDFCGLSSLIQTAGRVNRHGELPRGTVYFVRVAGEEGALSKLPDLVLAQNATSAAKQASSAPLDSAGVLTSYFKKLYGDEAKRPQARHRGKTEDELLDLLSVNSVARKELKKVGKNAHTCLFHALRTAGEAFRVIDENTVGVIVPWGGSKELVEWLARASDAQEIKRLVRQAQQFTVNVYDTVLRQLEAAGGLRHDNDWGLLVLQDGFYDETLGVVLEGRILSIDESIL